MRSLYLDFETRSTVDISKAGAWKYASDPSTDMICIGVAIDDGPVTVVKKPDIAAFRLPEVSRIVAHNAAFEYAICHFILRTRYGWPSLLGPKRWDCTMARSFMCGLPPSLEGLALTLRLPLKKDLEGRGALMKICKPQPLPLARGEVVWNEDPELYEKVYKYNVLDVEVERSADHKLPPLPAYERRLFEKDLEINRRGMAIDVRSCAQAVRIADGLTDGLNKKLRKLTGGMVSKASGVPELKRWIVSQGVPVPVKLDKKPDPETGEREEKETLDIEAVKDLLKSTTLPPLVGEVLRIRQQVGKSSVKKYNAMLRCACSDGRARGAYQYYGAHTGRWVGRYFQPANFPQGFADPAEQEVAVEMLGQGEELYRAVYGDKSMWALSQTLRAMIVPAPGKVFVNADLNAIECRILNWLAGEEWVMALFSRGESPYIRMAERIYDRTGLTKKGNPREYDIGKRSELGAGFGMGWRRFQASVYTETSKNGEGVWLEDDLAERAIKAYRGLHQRVVGFWYATEAAALNAVLNPTSVFACADGRVLWGMDEKREFLGCRLPSGRVLRYFRPEIGREGEKRSLMYWTKAGEGAIRTDPATNGHLGQYRTWGGEEVENIVQAVARDVMVHGMLAAEEKGLRVVLHNYDELNGETEERAGVLDELLGCMTENLPPWTAGLSVKAEGWVGRRYRK